MKMRMSPSGHFPALSRPSQASGGEFPGRRVARLRQIFERDGKHFARRLEHLHRLEIVGQQRGLERGRHDNDLEIGPRRLLNLPCTGQGEVAFEMALMKFVEDENADARKRRALLHLAQEDAFGDVENARVARGDIFEPVLETDFAAQLDAALFRDAPGQQTGGEPARLQDDDAARAGQAVIEEILRNLRRLAGAGRGLHDDAVLAAQHAREIAAQGK